MEKQKKLTELLKMPQEVEGFFQSLDNQKYFQEKEKVQLVYLYCKSFVHLYGMISYEDSLEMIKSQTEIEVSSTELEEILEIYPKSEEYVEFDEGFLLNPILILEELFPSYQAAIQDVPRFLPEQAELLKFSEDWYDEVNQATKNMENFLIALGYTAVQAENCLFDLMSSIMLGYHHTDLYPCLERDGITVVKAKERTILQKLLEELTIHSRTWRLKGHTPAELEEIPMVEEFDYGTYEAPPSKNATCPCGSGKKYKRCCGK